MTDEFRAMCEAVTEMAKEQLDIENEGCFLLYAHEKTENDDEIIRGAFGNAIDLMTNVTASALEILKRIPDKEKRYSMAFAMCSSVIHHLSVSEEKVES